MADRRNQRVEVTKHMLQDGLLRLLEDRAHYPDMAHITVTALCRESGVNRTTFYTHYSTPEDILDEIGRDMAAEFVEKERKKYPAGNQGTEALLTDLCRYLYANADKMKVLIRYHRDDDVRKTFPRFMKDDSPISQFFRSQFDESEIPLAATFLTAGSYALVKSWLMDDISKTPEEIAALVMKIARTNWLQMEAEPNAHNRTL